MHEIENDKLFRFHLILMRNFFHLNDLIDHEENVLIQQLNYHRMNSIFDEEQVEYKVHLKLFVIKNSLICVTNESNKRSVVFSIRMRQIDLSDSINQC